MRLGTRETRRVRRLSRRSPIQPWTSQAGLGAGTATTRQQRLRRPAPLPPLRRRGHRPRQCRSARALEIERPFLRSPPPRRTTDFEEDLVTVTRSGGFLLRRVFYTVPSRLIGHRLRVRKHDDRIECFLGSEPVLTLPRGRAPQGHTVRVRTVRVVDYRHVIHALRRKSQSLLNLVYRDQLFPCEEFREAWDALIATEPARNACRIMVRILALTHERCCEAELAAKLDAILSSGRLPDPEAMEARFARPASTRRRSPSPCLPREPMTRC